MNKLTPQERSECDAVVAAIMRDLESSKWNPPADVDYAKGALTSSRLSHVKVVLGCVDAEYRIVDKIDASSQIRISVPTKKYIHGLLKPTEKAAISSVVFGVLVHEITHVLQKQGALEAFNRSVYHEKTWLAMSSPSIDDTLDLYVGQPFEQEARAAQAAAEVFIRSGPQLTQTQFAAEITSTEVKRRTEKHIGPTGSSRRVDVWWDMWAALAWDFYK